MEDGAAGEAAVGVRATGSGSEGDREMLPVEHVWADGVSPMHVPPDGGIGIVLEEHVVMAVEIDGAVGVVHPVAGRKKMELRAEGIVGELGWGGRLVCEKIVRKSAEGGERFEEGAAGGHGEEDTTEKF